MTSIDRAFEAALVGSDRVAANDLSSLSMLDSMTGAQLWTVPASYRSVVASPDGSMLAGANTTTATWDVLDASSGIVLHSHPIDTSFNTTPMFSPDSSRLAIAHEGGPASMSRNPEAARSQYQGTTITIVDPRDTDARPLTEILSPEFNLSSLAFNADNTRLAAISSDIVDFFEWDLLTGEVVPADHAQPFAIVPFAVAYDGDQIWALNGHTSDAVPTVLQAYDPVSGAPAQSIEVGTGIVFSTRLPEFPSGLRPALAIVDGTAIIASSGRSVRVDLTSGRIGELGLDIVPVDGFPTWISSDGTRIASFQDPLRVEDGSRIVVFSTANDSPVAEAVWPRGGDEIVVTPDGEWVGDSTMSGAERRLVSIDGQREVLVDSGSVTRRWFASPRGLWDGVTPTRRARHPVDRSPRPMEQ